MTVLPTDGLGQWVYWGQGNGQAASREPSTFSFQPGLSLPLLVHQNGHRGCRVKPFVEVGLELALGETHVQELSPCFIIESPFEHGSLGFALY